MKKKLDQVAVVRPSGGDALSALLEAPLHPRLAAAPSTGAVIGVLAALTGQGRPLVSYPGQADKAPVEAETAVALTDKQVGCRIVLLFEEGDPGRPIVVGCLQDRPTQPALAVESDGERLVISAEKELVLRCGRASVTLTRAGKVLIRGAYLLSRSSGANRIKGASVQIN